MWAVTLELQVGKWGEVTGVAVACRPRRLKSVLVIEVAVFMWLP